MERRSQVEASIFSGWRVNLPRKRRRASNGKERVIITRLGIGQSHVNRSLLTVGKRPAGNNRRCFFSMETENRRTVMMGGLSNRGTLEG